MPARPMNKTPPGQVRIISGQWRGSKLPVQSAPGLRPTSDRVRETLFNWLQPHLPGKRVLDCFAGTGALGFEAMSRGAAELVMLERSAILANSLRETGARLKAGNITIETADCLAWLHQVPTRRFDIVFIDPPFATDYAQQLLPRLTPWLADTAWIYVETGRTTILELPDTYRLYREGSTREAWYRLFRHELPASAVRLSP
jgi:16S rRNA (guanine966-N2)-methyltransferase